MNLTELLPYVHDQLPGVPQPVALRALADAAREFFTSTGVWQVDLTPISLKAGRSVYELDVDSQQSIVSVMYVQRAVGKDYLRPVPNVEPLRTNSTGEPSMFFTLGDSIEVGPTPMADEDRALNVRAMVTFKRRGTEIPDALADEYVREISAKARWDLALQPNYANPPVAALAMQEYTSGLARAKRRAFFGYGALAPQVTLTGW